MATIDLFLETIVTFIGGEITGGISKAVYSERDEHPITGDETGRAVRIPGEIAREALVAL